MGTYEVLITNNGFQRFLAMVGVGADINTPDMTATTLLVIGIFLLMLEIKIVSQGLIGFLASLCLIAATVIIWRDGSSFWGVPVVWVIPVIGLVMVLGISLSVLGVKAYQEKVVSGYEGYIGEVAVASEALGLTGQVFFRGAYWQAESSTPVAKGENVRVVAAEKLKLYVEPV